MADLVLLGGGGHARSVVAALTLAGRPLRGYLAPVPAGGLEGIAYLGGDEHLDLLDPAEVELVNGLGTAASTAPRRDLHEAVVRRGFSIAPVLHPSAFIDPGVHLGSGVQVLAGAIVNVGADLRKGALINSGAIVEHDVIVAAHAHVAPGAVLAGGVRIGESTLVGLGARILQGVEVGSGSVVGAGAVVIRDVPNDTTVVGVPARLRTMKDEQA